jgi:hypothetical protein
MIAFGSSVGSDDRFARYAQPGITRAVGSDAVVLIRREANSIFAAYNAILEKARGHHHDRAHLGFSDRHGFSQADIRWRAKWGFASTLIAPARLGLLTLRSKAASVRMRLSGNG